LCMHSLDPGDLDIASPNVCPDCVLQLGYLPAWVDLSLVDACPVHARMLLRVCSICKHRLSWYRKGLLVCSCGASLSNQLGASISDRHAAMLDQIVAKVNGVASTNPQGMPASHFDSTSLRGLLGLVRGM